MKLNYLIVLLFSFGLVAAQYQEPEYEKYPREDIFPTVSFDSIAAKEALAKGTTKMTGVAFTRKKNVFGYKPPLAPKIKANHIMVELFPATPYFMDWYNLKKSKENLKRNKVVFMDTYAYKYRLTCETNDRGEFTFPEMKPGKYILMGILPWSEQGYYDEYAGSSYHAYGSVNHYDRQYYTITHSDLLIQLVEVEAGENSVKVKLK